MKPRVKVAVLISGSGSNLQALIDATRTEEYPAEISLVISNRPDVKGMERARRASLPVHLIDHKNFTGRSDFEAAIDRTLRENEIDIICLAGFMRVLTPNFVNAWSGRILNIHPSLLPDFKGLHVQQQALDAKATKSGCTVHVVTPELDDGPIIGQAVVPVLPDDTADTLATRIQGEEHKLYPACLEQFALGFQKPKPH